MRFLRIMGTSGSAEHGAGSVPAVSIVLAVHNGERFLDATLDSALTQTWTEFELLAVDDGSTDNSGALIARRCDPRIRLIQQKQQGAPAALAAGLRCTRGELVAILDQDDLWARENLARHVEAHRRRPEIDLTFSWFRVIDESGADIGLHSHRYRGTIDFPGLLKDFVIGGSSNVVVRRSAIERAGGVDPNLPRLYDLDLCLRVALLAPHNILAIEDDLMFYRRHASQISRDLPGFEAEWERALAKFERLAPEEFRRGSPQGRSNMCRYFAYLAYEEGSYG
ncbi:MAG TPA: glycosyltransferase, partial [Bryobacteraceae bacterium]